jgi:hypothetical protein
MNTHRQTETTLLPVMTAPLRADRALTEPNAGRATHSPAFEQPVLEKHAKATQLKKGGKKNSKKSWKKPKGKPNRPLSAYNFFFRQQRTHMLGDDKPSPMMELLKKRVHCKTHGKIGFAEMAREIGRKWKALDPETKAEFEAMAKKEKERYDIELAKWKGAQSEKDSGALDVMATAAVACEPFKDTQKSKGMTSDVQKIDPPLVRSDDGSKNRTTLHQDVPTRAYRSAVGRARQLSPLMVTPYHGPGSYYEALVLRTLPIMSQERLVLQQIYFAEAPTFEAEQGIPTQYELAFLSQARLRQQQILANGYHFF